jgi:hypothetical protein
VHIFRKAEPVTISAVAETCSWPPKSLGISTGGSGGGMVAITISACGATYEPWFDILE